MDSEFVKWDDLDLDFHLGERNWTDAEDEEVFGSENEWASSSSSDSDGTDEISTTNKHDKRQYIFVSALTKSDFNNAE